MPKFVKRSGCLDLNSNKYFNEATYVGAGGYYKNNSSYECVNYAMGRTCELAEEKCTYYDRNGLHEKRSDCRIPFNRSRSGYGHAKEWWNDTAWEKTTDPSKAKLGDIIVYGSGWGNGYGHVRIIEAIEKDYFICSGGNEISNGVTVKSKFDIKVKKTQGSGDALTGLVGYIHNPFLTDLSDVSESEYKKMYEQEKAENERLKSILRQINELSEV